ncbi:MAG: hypothetical protein ACAI44_04190 [Candidatus Sericytochromatia bacterium]
MPRKLLFWLAACLLAACTAPAVHVAPAASPSPSPSASPTPAPVISRLGFGSDAGLCIGYCHRSIQITAQSMRVVESASQEKEKYPDRIISQPTDAATWQKLVGLADWKVFSALPERIGCPDCADGGADWVELHNGDQSRRVTFEPPAGLPQQAALLTELKRLFQQLYSAGRFQPSPR